MEENNVNACIYSHDVSKEKAQQLHPKFIRIADSVDIDSATETKSDCSQIHDMAHHFESIIALDPLEKLTRAALRFISEPKNHMTRFCF